MQAMPWPGNPHVRPADVLVDVTASATLNDMARAVGQRLEARFATTGVLEVAAIGWHHDRVDVWIGEDAQQHARIEAAHADTRAVGMFGGGTDRSVTPEALIIGLAVETRTGEAITWRRRYDMIDETSARWRGDAVFGAGAKLGWFG